MASIPLVRDVVLTLTILALIFMAANQNPPSSMVQTDYCLNDYRAAGKDMFGNWQFGWARGYGPCTDQDIYRNI